jgi:hypothetical protein
LLDCTLEDSWILDIDESMPELSFGLSLGVSIDPKDEDIDTDEEDFSSLINALLDSSLDMDEGSS